MGTAAAGWERLQTLDNAAWVQRQGAVIVKLPDAVQSSEAMALIEQMGTGILGPALSAIKRSLSQVITGEIAMDDAVWSPSMDHAARAIKGILAAHDDYVVHPDALSNLRDREQLLSQVSEYRQGLTNNCRNAIAEASQAFTIHYSTAVGKMLEEIRAARDLGEEQTQATLRHSESVNRKTDELLSTAVLTAEARWLDKTQEAFARQSDAWLAGIVLSAALLLVVLTFFILSKPELPHGGESWTVASNLAHFGPRVALVSLLSTLVLVCVREYRAARHNHLVYPHRATTVSTVKALTKDGQGRLNEAILTLAAQSVFMPAATGFDKSEPMGPPAISPWLSDLRKPTDAGE